MAQTQMRALNVKDALSYLDEVKIQFSSQPEVYNKFLDIMKDFKMQIINTPGVIDRVSNLFRGHPLLIQGFNTFLPPGYHIDCSADPQSNLITITTPNGTITRTQLGGGDISTNDRLAGAGKTSNNAPTPAPKTNGSRATSGSAATSSKQTSASTSKNEADTNLEKARPPVTGYSGYTSNDARLPASAAKRDQPANPSASASNNSHAQSANDQRRTSGIATLPASQSVTNAPALSPVKQEPRDRDGPTAGMHLNLPSASVGPAGIAAPEPVATPGAASILGINNASAQQQPGQGPSTSLGGATQPPTGPSAQSAPVQRPAVEFNHAISYVNKIKTRFQNEPQIYKIFLEILQTYQKESRPIQDVYAQVTQLFATAPDLLEEFKQFLPDPALAGGNAPVVGASPHATVNGQVNPNGGAAGAAPYPPYVDNNWQYSAAQPANKTSGNRKRDRSPVANASLNAAAQGQEDKRRRKVGGSSASATAASLAATSRNKRARAAMPTSPEPMAVTPPPGSSIAQAAQSPYPKGSHGLPGQTLVTFEELGFFDRVKRHFGGDRLMHQEFLKLLNLSSQEHIDLPTLMMKAFMFLGSDEDLYAEFKTLVNWDQTEHGFVEGEEWIIDNVDALDRPRLDLNALKSHGPSYKRLPQTEVDLACSGRDALCWSVLNDEWVAHATWATEGSGTHRKNASEEALMFSEQERHWFSVTMETNSRAIAILEPQLHRIMIMDAEQRESFKLARGFNETHPSVIERAIKRVYGSDALGAASGTRQDHAREIIRALYESPALAVPTILNRLKQKNEDWTRALREWNKVWREVDCKNYYRSLDHQGVTFKTNDKRTIGTRSLIGEVEQLRSDQQQKRVNISATHAEGAEANGDAPSANQPTANPSPYQFELKMDDKSVIFDVMRLTFAYLERTQGGVSAPERQRIEGFIRLLVPMVFGSVTREQVHDALGHFEVKHHDDDFEEAAPVVLNDVDESDGAESDAGTATSNGGEREPSVSTVQPSQSSTSAPSGINGAANAIANRRPGPKAIAADLRRRLLERSIASVPPVSTAPSTTSNDPGLTEHETNLGKESVWIMASSSPYADSDENAAPPTPTTGSHHKRRRSSPRKSSPPRASSGAPHIVLSGGDRRHNFFANNAFYCLIRTFHMLYHRLQTLKIAAQSMAELHSIDRLSPLAVKMGLATPLPLIDTPALEGRPPEEAYYLHLLEQCERLFDNEIDSSTFEESLRLMWGIKAFPLYTVDRMVSAIIKHAHTINNDAQCQDLLLLLERDRSQPTTTMRQQIAYRMEAEKLLHDKVEAEKLWGVEDHIYRIEWLSESQTLAIQLLGTSDLTMDDKLNNARERFEYYVSSYALVDPTEGVGHKVSAPILKRNHRLASREEHPVRVKSQAEVKIGMKTFKLFHVGDTGDEICRKDAPALETSSNALEKGSRRFSDWLNSQVTEDGSGVDAMDVSL